MVMALEYLQRKTSASVSTFRIIIWRNPSRWICCVAAQGKQPNSQRMPGPTSLIEWRIPIETAPKNGTDILVATRETMHVVRWINIHGDFDYWAVDDNKHGPFTLRGKAPTHWMPLPEPPK